MSHYNLLIKGFWTLVFRTLGAGMAFLTTLLFARILEVEEFGLYSIGLTLVTVMSVFSRVGLDNIVLKQVATHLPDQINTSDGYIYSPILLTIFIAGLISVLLWNFSHPISLYIFNKPQLNDVLRAYSFLLVPISLVFILGEALKALGKPSFSAFYQTVAPPSFTLLIVVSLLYLNALTLNSLIISVVAGFTFSTLAYLILLRSHLTNPFKQRIPYRNLLIQGLPMLLLTSGSLIMAWSDVIILGAFSSAENVAVYSAASRTVMITVLILFAINAVTAPRYANMYRRGDIAGIASLAQNSSMIAFLMALPPTGIIFLYPEWIMQWFGNEYLSGSSILILLSIGQFINVSCGSVGYLLMMTGKEKVLRNILLVTATANILMSIIFLHFFGAIGVAMATSASVVIWNIWAVIEVKKHLNFWSIGLTSLLKTCN